jgi:hypothetical protein
MDDVLPRKSQSKPGSGAVLLHAREAQTHGSKLHYEAQPHKDTLGVWTQQDDWVEWAFQIPTVGMFEVQVLQGCGKGSGGAKVEVAVNGQTLDMMVVETGHFQRFVPRTIGTVRFDQADRYSLSIRAKTNPGGAVMDLRRVVLRAVP